MMSVRNLYYRIFTALYRLKYTVRRDLIPSQRFRNFRVIQFFNTLVYYRTSYQYCRKPEVLKSGLQQDATFADNSHLLANNLPTFAVKFFLIIKENQIYYKISVKIAKENVLILDQTCSLISCFAL